MEDEGMIQRQVSLEDEEPLQGKFSTTQREKLPEEEEPIQSKAEAVQRQESLEEEEPLQGRFESVQRQSIDEDEEPLQGKSLAIQREGGLEEEEPLQAQTQPAQQKENRTGLPDDLKAGVENLSGLSMDDVEVHYNSAAPATVQALAYTQGTEIHVGPGQEQHLAHEAWHVAQQKQGRVKPTMQARGVAINDDTGLEREADVMGGKAEQHPAQRMESSNPVGPTSTVYQRYTDPPLKIVVDVDSVSGKILKVKNDVGGDIPFVFADTHKGNVPEGSVVFLNTTTVASVRFATDTTDISNLGGMRKIAPKNVETREVEGVKEEEEKPPIKEVEEETGQTFDLSLKALKKGRVEIKGKFILINTVMNSTPKPKGITSAWRSCSGKRVMRNLWKPSSATRLSKLTRRAWNCAASLSPMPKRSGHFTCGTLTSVAILSPTPSTIRLPITWESRSRMLIRKLWNSLK
jgi:hypothetical protein